MARLEVGIDDFSLSEHILRRGPCNDIFKTNLMRVFVDIIHMHSSYSEWLETVLSALTINLTLAYREDKDKDENYKAYVQTLAYYDRVHKHTAVKRKRAGSHSDKE